MADPDWDQAACAMADPDVFFPDVGENITAARRICEICPITEDCLDHALAHPGLAGVWGGTTDPQRRALRRRLQEATR